MPPASFSRLPSITAPRVETFSNGQNIDLASVTLSHFNAPTT